MLCPGLDVDLLCRVCQRHPLYDIFAQSRGQEASRRNPRACLNNDEPQKVMARDEISYTEGYFVLCALPSRRGLNIDTMY